MSLLSWPGDASDRVAVHLVSLHTDYLERSGRERVDPPGVTSWDDAGGKLAQRFGVLTSGHVLLYDTDGRLLYSGGITPFAVTAARTQAVGRCSRRFAVVPRIQ